MCVCVYLATRTLDGSYCFRSASSLFIVRPVSMMSWRERERDGGEREGGRERGGGGKGGIEEERGKEEGG